MTNTYAQAFGANQAAAVDAPIAHLLRMGGLLRRATAQRR